MYITHQASGLKRFLWTIYDTSRGIDNIKFILFIHVFLIFDGKLVPHNFLFLFIRLLLIIIVI